MTTFRNLTYYMKQKFSMDDASCLSPMKWGFCYELLQEAREREERKARFLSTRLLAPSIPEVTLASAALVSVSMSIYIAFFFFFPFPSGCFSDTEFLSLLVCKTVTLCRPQSALGTQKQCTYQGWGQGSDAGHPPGRGQEQSGTIPRRPSGPCGCPGQNHWSWCLWPQPSHPLCHIHLKSWFCFFPSTHSKATTDSLKRWWLKPALFFFQFACVLESGAFSVFPSRLQWWWWSLPRHCSTRFHLWMALEERHFPGPPLKGEDLQAASARAVRVAECEGQKIRKQLFKK